MVKLFQESNNLFDIEGSRGKQKMVALPTIMIVHGNMMEKDKDLGQVVRQKQ